MLLLVVLHYTRRIKKATREVRKKEGEMVSVIQEVLSSMRVVKAFGREEYEQGRMAEGEPGIARDCAARAWH